LKKPGFDKFIFLDRDGVINRDSPNYIKSWSEFEFLPGSLTALKQLNLNGFAAIIITNQSAVNRNLISRTELETIHAMMKNRIQSQGGEIKDIFFCPHTPEDGCDCRKPKPGLIYKATKKYRIDLSRSIMVGDSVRDIECAWTAGCEYAVLVKTGYGVTAEKSLAERGIFADYVAADLYEAAQWIMALSM
jgi:D-glycero-D-manno-heptose 1,7-bisphosphate phosphatase